MRSILSLIQINMKNYGTTGSWTPSDETMVLNGNNEPHPLGDLGLLEQGPSTGKIAQ